MRSIRSWHSLSAANDLVQTTSSGNLAPMAVENVVTGDDEAGRSLLPKISIESHLKSRGRS